MAGKLSTHSQLLSFPSLCFSENYHLAVLGSKKFYSHEIQASSPCSRNLLQGTRSPSSTLACQKIFQGFSWSKLCFNRALHSLITEGNLQSPFNSGSLTGCELNNGNCSCVCSVCSRPVPNPPHPTATTTALSCTAAECQSSAFSMRNSSYGVPYF